MAERNAVVPGTGFINMKAKMNLYLKEQLWDWRCSSVGRVLTRYVRGPGFDPQLSMKQILWCRPVIPALEGWRKEDQKFCVNLSCVVSLRPAWTTGAPVSKTMKVHLYAPGLSTPS